MRQGSISNRWGERGRWRVGLLLLVSFPLSAWAAPVPFLVKDINPSPGVGSMDAQRAFGTLGDHVFFGANDGVNGYDFWKSYGTPEGTVPVSNTRLGRDR